MGTAFPTASRLYPRAIRRRVLRLLQFAIYLFFIDVFGTLSNNWLKLMKGFSDDLLSFRFGFLIHFTLGSLRVAIILLIFLLIFVITLYTIRSIVINVFAERFFKNEKYIDVPMKLLSSYKYLIFPDLFVLSIMSAFLVFGYYRSFHELNQTDIAPRLAASVIIFFGLIEVSRRILAIRKLVVDLNIGFVRRLILFELNSTVFIVTASLLVAYIAIYLINGPLEFVYESVTALIRAWVPRPRFVPAADAFTMGLIRIMPAVISGVVVIMVIDVLVQSFVVDRRWLGAITVSLAIIAPVGMLIETFAKGALGPGIPGVGFLAVLALLAIFFEIVQESLADLFYGKE